MDEVAGLGHRGAAPRDRRASPAPPPWHICYGYGNQGEYRLEGDARPAMEALREDVSSTGQSRIGSGLARVPQFERTMKPAQAARRQGRAGRVIDVASMKSKHPRGRDVIGEAMKYVAKEKILPSTNCGMAPMRRDIASAKLEALGRGAELARRSLGTPRTAICETHRCELRTNAMEATCAATFGSTRRVSRDLRACGLKFPPFSRAFDYLAKLAWSPIVRCHPGFSDQCDRAVTTSKNYLRRPGWHLDIVR